MAFFLLGVSIFLSTGRNILSKNLSDVRFGTRRFFLYQGILFLCGCAVLVLLEKLSFAGVSIETVIYAIFYGILLIFAQWFYTAAISRGNTALCSTVYSLGFVIPTLSGAILWSEAFTYLDAVGILCAALAVIISGSRSKTCTTSEGGYYFIPLVIAMIASGGLGIIQKLQQRSFYAEQKSVFLLIAFLFAASVSFLFALFSKQEGTASVARSKLITSVFIGICFGCCNLLNTTLAGMLDSAVFFPTLNIGVVLLSMLSGIIFLGEKISKKVVAILFLGLASILLLNLG